MTFPCVAPVIQSTAILICKANRIGAPTAILGALHVAHFFSQPLSLSFFGSRITKDLTKITSKLGPKRQGIEMSIEEGAFMVHTDCPRAQSTTAFELFLLLCCFVCGQRYSNNMVCFVLKYR